MDIRTFFNKQIKTDARYSMITLVDSDPDEPAKRKVKVNCSNSVCVITQQIQVI